MTSTCVPATAFWTGESLGFAEAQHASRHGAMTVPAGSLHANPWGLYDMHGNVWEWCWDAYGPYPQGSVVDPVGSADVSRRVARGGCWGSDAASCRSAARKGLSPWHQDERVGFRLAITPA